MVVRLSDSQIEAFKGAGVDEEQIGTMIANARSQGIGDDLIYADLSNRASGYAKYAGMQIQELDQQADKQEQQSYEQATPEIPMLLATKKQGENAPFFKSDAPDVMGNVQKAFNAQQAAYNYGKSLNWMESATVAAGDALMMSTEDFVYPEAEMIRAGIQADNPWAGAVGAIAGSALGIPGRAAKAGVKLAEKLSGKATKNMEGKVKKALIKGGLATAIDAGIGTLSLATKDAIQAMSKNEEWRTFRIDARRYTDDFGTGLVFGGLLGVAGPIVGRYRRGSRQLLERLGGEEKINALQLERQRLIDNGMSEVDAQEWFRKSVLGSLTPEEQAWVAKAAKTDPQVRQYLDDISVTLKTDIDRSAEMITKKEIKEMTDDGMGAIKRNLGLGDVDFDTSSDGLARALGTKSAKNLEIGRGLAEEGNILLTQDKSIYDAFKAKTRQIADEMKNPDAKNALIAAAVPDDFSQLKAMNIAPEQQKQMAMNYVRDMLENGMDSVTQLNEMKALIDRVASQKVVQAGKGSSLGNFRERLNREVLEGVFGEANNPATLSGKYRGYHNVKKFEDMMLDAHKFGKELDPVAQADTLASFLNEHGHAGADEAIAFTTALKIGYLDKLKDLAKQGKHNEWRLAVDGIKKNPNLNTIFGGDSGIKKYVEAMEPEVKAAQSLKNILISSRPGAQSDKVVQDMLGAAVATATNSPMAVVGRLERIWNAINPAGITPAVGKNLTEMLDEPTWNNFNKFINSASKDPATRLQLSRAINEWFQEAAVGATVSSGEMQRGGLQNTPVFEGVR